MEDDGFSLEFLDSLTFYDQVFEHDGVKYHYDDITHITYKAIATRHSINLIPTGTSYETDLFVDFKNGVRLSIDQTHGFLNRGGKDTFEAVGRANEILSEITFTQRVEEYESQMASQGYVTWGQYQIHRNGDLYKNFEFKFNLKSEDVECGLGVFELTCSQKARGLMGKFIKGLFGTQEIINIQKDRDCFLYVLKKYHALGWRKEHVREKKLNNQRAFYEALLILGAQISKADGKVTPEEILAFKTYFKIDETVLPDAGKIFNEAVQTKRDTIELAGLVFERFVNDPEVLEFIVIGLMRVASADGNFDTREQDLIRCICRAFKFENSQIQRLFVMFGVGQKNHSKGAHHSAFHSDYAILGVTEDATLIIIKTAYRDLARKYHPDILIARGVPAGEIVMAENMLKEINGAYGRLLKRHMAAA